MARQGLLTVLGDSTRSTGDTLSPICLYSQGRITTDDGKLLTSDRDDVIRPQEFGMKFERGKGKRSAFHG